MKRLGTACLAGFLLALLAFAPESRAQDNAGIDHPLFEGPAHEVPRLLFDQEHIRLTVRFEPEDGRLFGIVKLRVRALSDTLRTLPLDAGPLDIYSVQVGTLDSLKRETAYTDSLGMLWISLDSLEVSSEPFEVQVTYSTTPAAGMHFRKIDPADSSYSTHIWTDTTPGTLKHWLPVIDHPSERVTSEILATVPPAMSVVSNGRLVQEMDTEDEMKLFHYVQDRPHALRGIGLVAGHFRHIQESVSLSDGNTVNVETWAPAYAARQIQRTFEEIPDIITFFSDELDYNYPWPAYSQVVFDGLLTEDISYTGFSLLSDRVLKNERVAIDEPGQWEMASMAAKQWSGHLLSVDFWSDLWLTESLSRYLGLMYLKDRSGEASYYTKLAALKDQYLAEAASYRRPLVWNQWDTPLSLFDAHARAKGVWVFHMLNQNAGEPNFWAVLANFARRMAYQPVTTDDLLASTTEVLQRSVAPFFDDWVYSAGHPVFDLNYQHDLIAESLYVSVDQIQEGYLVTSRFGGQLDLESYSLAGPTRHTVTFKHSDELFTFPMAIAPRYLNFDPDHVLLAEKNTQQTASAWMTQLRYASNPLSQLEAIQHLHDFDDDPALLIGLQSALNSRPIPEVRAGILELIAALPPSDATKRTIIDAYEDPSPIVQKAVLRSLESFEDHSDLIILAMESAQNSQSYKLQAQAVETLARIGAAGAADIIESALITPSHRDVIRQAAIRSLTYLRLSTRERVQKLLDLTRPSHSTETRRAAINSLGELAALNNRQSLAAIVDLLDDRDPLIRKAAIHALGATNLDEAFETLQNHSGAEIDPKVLQTTRSVLRDLRIKQNAAGSS